ncbi:unnamed protein product, partial [Ectocarpus sp. 12 AP-2014]
MWNRKSAVATKLEGEQQQHQRRDRSGNLVEAAGGGKECRRSQAVQVSPEHLLKPQAASSSSTAAAAAVGNFEASSVEGSRYSLAAGEVGGAWSGSLAGEGEGTAVACAVEEGGARGDGNRRLLRWRSIRRLQQYKSSGDVSGKSTVNVGGKGTAACGSSTQSPSRSPSRLSLGRLRRGSATAANTTGTAVVAPAPTPAARSPGVCLIRRTAVPPQQRGDSLDDHLATSSGNASPYSKAIG